MITLKKEDAKSQRAAYLLETRILPRITEEAHREMLQAGIAFLKGKNPHLSGFIQEMNFRWQGVEFVIWIEEIIEPHLRGHYPALTGIQVCECMTPFLHALLHHRPIK